MVQLNADALLLIIRYFILYIRRPSIHVFMHDVVTIRAHCQTK